MVLGHNDFLIFRCYPKMAQGGPKLILAWLLQFRTGAFLHWSL